MTEVIGKLVDRSWHNKTVMPVLIGSCLIPLMIIVATVLQPSLSKDILSRAADVYLALFPRWIIWSVSFFLIVTALVAVIPTIGRRTLGTQHDHPQFSFFSWFSMIFGTGMAVGLLTWGVAEPIAGMQNNPDIIRGLTTAESTGNTPSALTWSYAHWGLAGWAGYAVVGLAVAYTGHRQSLPLTIRSALIPLFGNGMKGPFGHLIDIATVVVTLLGVVQVLGYALDEFVVAVAQTTGVSGLLQSNGSASVAAKVGASVFIMALSALSALSGVFRGVKWFSNINLLLSFAVLAILLIAGSFKDGLFILFSSLLDYLINLPSMMFEVWSKDGTEVGDKLQAWQGTWTLYHWTGWWLAFSPFIGVFLARISKGRTIRQYVFATVVLPALLTIVWMSWVGGNAMSLELSGVTNGELSSVGVGEKIFAMLPYLFEPWATTSVSMLLLLMLISYLITTIDSAVIVTSMVLKQELDTVSSRALVLTISILLTIALIILVQFNGLSSVRSSMVLAAAPLSVLMVTLCIALGIAIYKDQETN